MIFVIKFKNTILLTLILLSLLVVIKPSFAEDKPVTLDTNAAKKIDLNEALGIALQQNRPLLEAKQDDKVYKYQLKEEFTNFLPTLGVTNDYQYNANVKQINIPGLGTFSSSRANQNTTLISATQPIFDLYKTSLNYRIAKANYTISTLNTQLQTETTINDVSGFYLDIIKQKRLIELTKENLVRLKGYYDVAYNRYKEGDALSRDYMKIQIELDSSQHTLMVQNDELDMLILRFKNALALPLDENVELDEKFAEETLMKQSLAEMQQIALENRPEVEQINKTLYIAKLNKKLKYADYIPEANLVVSYGHYINSGFSSPNTVLLGVNLTYDFWKWGQKFWSVKEKGAEVDKVELQREDLKDQIFLDVKSQLNTTLESKDQIAVSGNNVVLAKESLRITTNRYAEGIALILDLLDDQTTYLQAQVDLVSAELDYQKNLIQLKKTLGILTYVP